MYAAVVEIDNLLRNVPECWMWNVSSTLKKGEQKEKSKNYLMLVATIQYGWLFTCEYYDIMQNERSDDLLAVALLYYVRDDKYSPIYTQNYINKTAAIPGVQKKKIKIHR